MCDVLPKRLAGGEGKTDRDVVRSPRFVLSLTQWTTHTSYLTSPPPRLTALRDRAQHCYSLVKIDSFHGATPRLGA